MYLYIYLSHVCINITVGHCISTRVASRHVDLLDTSSCRQMLHDASRIGCKRPSFAPKMRSKDDLRCLWLSVQRPTLTLSKIIPTALQRGVSPGKTFPPWRANRRFFSIAAGCGLRTTSREGKMKWHRISMTLMSCNLIADVGENWAIDNDLMCRGTWVGLIGTI